MCLALVSLDIMHRLVRDRLGWRVGWAFVLASLILAGIGIHLGRVQRYNSWDVATHPRALLEDILVPLVHPLMHPHTAFDALRYTTILLVGYVAFLALRSKQARALIITGRDDYMYMRHAGAGRTRWRYLISSWRPRGLASPPSPPSSTALTVCGPICVSYRAR